MARAKTVAYLNLVSIANYLATVTSTGTRPGWKATIKTWIINWGDGTASNGTGVPSPSQRTHVYAATGTYPANLTVKDSKGVTASSALTIAVSVVDPVPPPPPPVLYILSVVNGSGSGNYAQGSIVAVTATTAPSGQAFWQWTGVTVANATQSSTTLIMPANDAVVTARYVSVPAPLTVICPTIAPTNSPNGQPVAVTYAATSTGGTAPVTFAYTVNGVNTPSGSLFPVGSTQVNVVATDALSATSSCSFTVTIGAQVPTTVLQGSDFTYLGSLQAPSAGQAGTSFSFSNGRLSGRLVAGNIHLFLSQANPSVNTGTDAVAELLYTNISTPLSVVTNWGDVTKGSRVTAGGGALPMGGLHWDTTASQLWWTYGQVYSGNNVYNPSIGTSTLTGTDNTGVTAYGPWRLGPYPNDVSQKTRGYLYALRSDIVTALGGKRFAVGSPLTSGNSSSPWGAYAAAFTPPANGTPASVTTNSNTVATCTDLIFTDIDHPQYRPPDTDWCGWTHYGEFDTLGAQPQNNTTQNGSGCTVNGQLCGAILNTGGSTWTSLDQLSAATGIYGVTKSGIVYIGAVCRTITGHTYAGNGRNHVWYGPTQDTGQHLCVHGQNGYQYGQSTGEGTTTMLSSMYIYDVADLLAVANGTKSATNLPPVVDGYDLSQTTHPNGPPFPQVAGTFTSYGGCWFEPTNKLLFVSDVSSFPVVHVFSVNC